MKFEHLKCHMGCASMKHGIWQHLTQIESGHLAKIPTNKSATKDLNIILSVLMFMHLSLAWELALLVDILIQTQSHILLFLQRITELLCDPLLCQNQWLFFRTVISGIHREPLEYKSIPTTW